MDQGVRNLNSYCRQMSDYAIKSMLYEVAVSPKPGLVDRNNAGAHDDMDIFTFMDSISVLGMYFYQCAEKALNFQEDNYIKLMESLRPIGIEAENDMFGATNGVNTHKGMIFSLGILSAAAASIYKETGQKEIGNIELASRVKEMTKGISKELKNSHEKSEEDLTYGEFLYRKHDIRGIRGEVEDGFPTVIDFALPSFKKLYRENDNHINDILVNTLLSLMAETEDSNVLGRHDLDTLYYVQKRSKKALELGGAFTKEGLDYIEAMDQDFIEKNISSGGAADLLSVSLMFYLLEGGDL